MTAHPVVDHLTEHMRLIPCVDRMILFGSRARGDAKWYSDIDLAVSCPRAGREEWGSIWDLVDEAPTLLDIDLVRLDDASERMRETIRKEGIVLYERR